MYNHTGIDYAKRFFNSKNANSYNRIVKLATVGQDEVWKRKMIKYVNRKSVVLELANGTGILSSKLVKNQNLIYGIDLTFEYLKLVNNKYGSIMSINGTAEVLPFKNNSVDYVISSYLIKYVDFTRLIDECYRVLRNNGLIILHDFSYPQKRLYQIAWKTYFHLLRSIGRFDRNWIVVFNELDKLIVNSRWFQELPSILSKRNFRIISSKYLTFETSAMIVAKKNE